MQSAPSIPVPGHPPPRPPDWGWVLHSGENAALWRTAKAAAKNGPRILIATSTGRHPSAINMDGLLAAALTLRGAAVTAMLCDEALPACQLESWDRTPQIPDLCSACYAPAYAMYRALDIPVRTFGALGASAGPAPVEAALPLEDLKDWKIGGAAVGEHALAGVLRFLGKGTLDLRNPREEECARRYAIAAEKTYFAAARLFAEQRFDAIVLHHGIYVPQGVLAEVARLHGIRPCIWLPAYRRGTFIFSHQDTYHHTLLDEPSSVWEGLELGPEKESALEDYLRSREYGTNDWISFLQNAESDPAAIREKLGLREDLPVIGLLTNVTWDAQLHYRARAFADLMQWVRETISYFAGRPDLQLVIRIHPGEVTGPVRSAEPLDRLLTSLPPNVFLIPAASTLSTYAAMSLCDAVLIYATKAGVEFAARGIPVIAAGEAWIRNKGIAQEAVSASDYFAMLDRLPSRSSLPPETVLRARKYAYHFFFRRMIPVLSISPSAIRQPLAVTIEDLSVLLPGSDPGLDTICDGIMKGSPFVYDGPVTFIPQNARAAAPGGAEEQIEIENILRENAVLREAAAERLAALAGLQQEYSQMCEVAADRLSLVQNLNREMGDMRAGWEQDLAVLSTAASEREAALFVLDRRVAELEAELQARISADTPPNRKG